MMIPPDLEAAIQRYETAIAAIENTIQTAVMLQAKVIRDRRLNNAVKSATRDALSAANASKLQLQQVAIEATQQVMTEQSVLAIAREINVALNTDATHPIEAQNIDAEINKIIDAAAKELTNEQILEVLTARDAVQLALSQETPIFTGQLLEKLKRGDRYLKSRKWLALISQIDLGEWRDIFHPPETAWWWYLEFPPPLTEPEPPQGKSVWDRFDWLWDFFTRFFLTISVSLVGNVATKVFSGESDNFLGIFSVVAPSVITFLSGKQALTQKGKEDIQRRLENWHIDRKYIQEARCIIAALICGAILIFYYLFVPHLANCLGDHYQESGKLALAKEQYELAIELKYVPAYPKLAGVLVNQGKSQYEYADRVIREGLDLAQDEESLKDTLTVLNKLAREYNKQKNTTDAIPLLHKGWQNTTKQLGARVIYDLRINYGWAYLNKEDYEYAKSQLESAGDLILQSDELEEVQKTPDRYCLLAMVYQKLNEKDSKRLLDENKYWEECIKYVENETPEEVEWRQTAQEESSSLK